MKSSGFAGTGIITLLAIFGTLSLMVLGVAGYTSFANTSTTVQKALDGMQEEREAAYEVEEKLAEIDEVLWEAQQHYESQEEYFAAALVQVAALGCRVEKESRVVTLHVLAGQDREWVLKVEILPPNSEYRYSVLSRNLHSTAEWKPDQSINLLNPAAMQSVNKGTVF